jgi:hypothetical protein
MSEYDERADKSAVGAINRPLQWAGVGMVGRFFAIAQNDRAPLRLIKFLSRWVGRFFAIAQNDRAPLQNDRAPLQNDRAPLRLIKFLSRMDECWA